MVRGRGKKRGDGEDHLRSPCCVPGTNLGTPDTLSWHQGAGLGKIKRPTLHRREEEPEFKPKSVRFQNYNSYLSKTRQEVERNWQRGDFSLF